MGTTAHVTKLSEEERERRRRAREEKRRKFEPTPLPIAAGEVMYPMFATWEPPPDQLGRRWQVPSLSCPSSTTNTSARFQ